MRKFLERAMDKVSRMNEESIRGLLRVLVGRKRPSRVGARLHARRHRRLRGYHVPILVNKAAERLLPMAQAELFDAPLW